LEFNVSLGCQNVAWIGEERGVYSVLVGKPEGKRPLGRPRLSWEDNIRIDLHEVECGVMNWIGLAQDADIFKTLVFLGQKFYSRFI
jgi:hypothetical protein